MADEFLSTHKQRLADHKLHLAKFIQKNNLIIHTLENEKPGAPKETETKEELLMDDITDFLDKIKRKCRIDHQNDYIHTKVVQEKEYTMD